MSRKSKALEFVDEGYNIKVIGRHVEVTDSMKNYAIEKVSKIERFINRIIEVNIIIDVQRAEHRVEIILKAGHTKIASHAVTNDMYASIDKAVTRIEAQLRRYKQKLQDYHSKSAISTEMKVNVFRSVEEGMEWEEENGVEDNKKSYRLPEIVQQENLPLKMLTHEEALMKMELSRDHFMIFKCEEDQKLKVIYRLENGDYGIVEPNA